MVEPDTTLTVPSFDGTELAVQTFGGGPALLIGNGIGVDYRGLHYQIEHLRRSLRVVTWDYRGVFRSGRPRAGGVGVTTHARDCLAILKALDIDRAAFLGWSMGVQVGFEIVKLEPERLVRLAAMSGVAGKLFTAPRHTLPGANRVMPPLLDGLARVAPLLSGFTRRFVPSRPAFWGACLIKFVRPDADRELFATMASGVGHHDHRVYLSTLAELGRHDATQHLPRIHIPLLFLVGSEDHMTPPELLEQLAARAPNARVHVVPEASHFLTIEAPEQVNRALEDFYRPWAQQGSDSRG